MEPIRYLGGVALVFVLGCQGMPTVTRTGDVKDIMVGDSLTSGYIAVGPGDEVRWINKRSAPVRIIFLDPEWDEQLSCKNNFGGWMTRSDTAKLGTNETASVCFRDAGTFRYTVRMESDRASGDLNVSGIVKVGGQGGQAVDQTSDQNFGRTSDQPRDPTSGLARDQLSDQTGGGISDQPGGGPTSGPTGSTSTTTTTTTTMPAQQ
jgi:plastocyanin